MNIKDNSIFNIEPNSRVTYINQLTGEKWPKWKLYKDCDEKEKEKINLAYYPSDTILFDRDLPKEYNDDQIMNDYNKFKTMLNRRGIKHFYSYRSPKGYHVLARFKNFKNLDDELKKQIRKYYVSIFTADPAKISDRGVVSLPGKPHFKNGVVYDIFENNEGQNEVNQIVLETCRDKIQNINENIKQINQDTDFKDYFLKDPFFKFIRNNIIPDGTNRDYVIFPNLAIACAKSGKSKDEIDLIIKPLIKNNFPGKSYAEFEGWYKKAISGQITDYNPIQINNWMNSYTDYDKPIYDLNPVSLENLNLDEKYNYKFKYYWDDELKDMDFEKTEWIVENWIPQGDICFVAGKAASFKTTSMLHLSYCIANNKPVFNKYKVKESKVLYLNEENSNPILLSMVKRVKNGLDIKTDNKNVCFTMLENIRLDNLAHLEELANKIKENNINVLICDSLRRFISFDENNATDINNFFNYMKLLRKSVPKLTIIILHHLKKNNSQYSQDLRDMLRGSSDIVNSADSIIGMSRKHGMNAIKIEHIKNRSGEEMTSKLIKIDSGEENDMAYMYESGKEINADKFVSKDEECAEKIVQFLKEKKMSNFARKDIIFLEDEYSRDTISKALRLLKYEDTIVDDGATGGRYKRYNLNI